jgi:hypothetical protein
MTSRAAATRSKNANVLGQNVECSTGNVEYYRYCPARYLRFGWRTPFGFFIFLVTILKAGFLNRNFIYCIIASFALMFS